MIFNTRYIVVIFFLITYPCIGVDDWEDYKKNIEIAKDLNFELDTLVDGWYTISRSKNKFGRIFHERSDTFYLNPRPIIVPQNFDSGSLFTNYEGEEGYSVYFDEIGAQIWSEVTKKNINKYLVFIMDDRIFAAQKIRAQITSGICAFWREDISDGDWKKIKTLIED